jgi:hypothetical protein
LVTELMLRRSAVQVVPPSSDRRRCSRKFGGVPSHQARYTRRRLRGSTAIAIRELTRTLPSNVPTGGTVTPVTTRRPARPSPGSVSAVQPPLPQLSSRTTTTSDPPGRTPMNVP